MASPSADPVAKALAQRDAEAAVGTAKLAFGDLFEESDEVNSVHSLTRLGDEVCHVAPVIQTPCVQSPDRHSCSKIVKLPVHKELLDSAVENPEFPTDILDRVVLGTREKVVLEHRIDVLAKRLLSERRSFRIRKPH